MENSTISTRDRIINSALSFYGLLNLERISLSKIAARAGLSKAAIYKHFKGREDLEDAILGRIFDSILPIVRDIENSVPTVQEAIEKLIVYLSKNKKFIYYLVSNSVNFKISNFISILSSAGMSLLNGLSDSEGKILRPELLRSAIFILQTILVFQISRDSEIAALGFKDSDEEITGYARGLSKFIMNGLGGSTDNVEILRLSMLDELCRRGMEFCPKPQRELVAVAEIVEKSGFKGVTVDEIASHLRMARSSIYTNFVGKEAMINALIQNEIGLMLDAIKRNILMGNTPEECLYILMETEFEYFLRRKEVFIAIMWAQFQNITMLEREIDDSKFHEMYAFLCNCDIIGPLPNLGNPDIGRRAFMDWCFTAPIFLLMNADSIGRDREILSAALKDIFYMIETGAKFG